ncbi:hypothetical protein BSIN_4469 [Burkholderia singularis]|uniref:Uncharacterized protein n=1 Tax=Burkholderia singularis TaxID=1503053 RepID=A0A238H9A8_9BURK|nr:hypothetical protein BSIN_4469 [Burkholderia singularis]
MRALGASPPSDRWSSFRIDCRLGVSAGPGRWRAGGAIEAAVEPLLARHWRKRAAARVHGAHRP